MYIVKRKLKETTENEEEIQRNREEVKRTLERKREDMKEN